MPQSAHVTFHEALQRFIPIIPDRVPDGSPSSRVTAERETGGEVVQFAGHPANARPSLAARSGEGRVA